MALFTKRKLSDSERQAWSAQLLEVRRAELDKFGEVPTLGSTWEENDSEWNRLYATEYFPKYGVLAAAEMHADGYRLSGYRGFLFDVAQGGMIILADELEELPPDMAPGAVYWTVNTGTYDEEGNQVWLFQFVASSWKYAKSHMKDRVKEWDLENKRKGLFLQNWDRYFNFVALALLIIVTVIALVPVAYGVALGIVLGETISITGAIAALGAGAAAGWGTYGGYLAIAQDKVDLVFGQPDLDAQFVDSTDQFNRGDAVLVFEGNTLTEQTEAPARPAALESGGLTPLLLAASALFWIL